MLTSTVRPSARRLTYAGCCSRHKETVTLHSGGWRAQLPPSHLTYHPDISSSAGPSQTSWFPSLSPHLPFTFSHPYNNPYLKPIICWNCHFLFFHTQYVSKYSPSFHWVQASGSSLPITGTIWERDSKEVTRWDVMRGSLIHKVSLSEERTPETVSLPGKTRWGGC